MKILILSIMVLLCLSCGKKEEIPKELNIAFEYLNKNWDKDEIEIFKNISEKDTATQDYHFGIGLLIRNNLLRHNENSEILEKFFDSLDIHHYDDISGIILNSYHNYLNNKNIQLNRQVSAIQKYWKPILDCEKEQKIIGLNIFERYKTGDTINIKMPVNENSSVINYKCPYTNMKWKFNESKDLSINGIITYKHILKDSTNAFFWVDILSKSKPKVKIYYSEKNIGDDFKVYLQETAWIIK